MDAKNESFIRMNDKIDVLWEGSFDNSGYGIWSRKTVEALSQSDKYKIGITPYGRTILPDDDLYKYINVRLENPIKVMNSIPTKSNIPSGNITGYCTCTEIKNPPQDHINNMNKAKFVLALSSYCTQIYKDVLDDPEKVFQVNFPIPRGTFTPVGPRMTFENHDDKFKFLFVGRIDVRKNITDLIKAFTEEFGKNKNVLLILKIYSPDYSVPMWINKQNPSKNILLFPDKMTDMSILYRSCDAYVTSDLGEAWSAPTQEAMLCGLPAIAPRHSGHLDYMNEDNSWLVDVSDWKPIGDRIDNLYESLLPAKGLVKYPDIDSLKNQMRNVYETFKFKPKEEVLKHPKIQNALKTQDIVDYKYVLKQLDDAFNWITQKYKV